MKGVIHTNAPAGPWLVLYYETLMKNVFELVGSHARHRIRHTTCAIRNHDLHRSHRPLLRVGISARRQNCQTGPHRRPPSSKEFQQTLSFDSSSASAHSEVCPLSAASQLR